jgi:hypothetical protein
MTGDEVRQRVRGGHLRRLDTGVYLRLGARTQVLDSFAEGRVAHVERGVAATLRHRGSVIGYTSAALAHGLPTVGGVPALVQVIAAPGGWTGLRNGVRYRRARLVEDDVHTSGARVTSIPRTVVDVARTTSLADGLAVGDAALRLHDLPVADAWAVLARLGRVRGCRRAARALAHLDARRETALESLSWARFIEWRLPLPDMQHEVVDDDGLVGRVDFWWPNHRIVGEADGRLKYATAEDLYAEKRREDRLRAAGLRVVRWGWADLWGPAGQRLCGRLLDLLR